MVAAVAITPMRPVRVACTAARAAGSMMPVNGTGSCAPRSAEVELTVPHAAITIFTWWCMRNAISCWAYLRRISRLREPYGTRPVSPK